MNTIELLMKADGLLSGHFCLTSGLHSDTYFQCAKLYQYPNIVEQIAEELAKKLEGVEFDTIVAPAIGAIIFGYEVAKKAGVRNLFVERKDGVMALRRGYNIKKGERVVIIEDVITTARTIYETIDCLKEFEPEIVGVGCIVNRGRGKIIVSPETEFSVPDLRCAKTFTSAGSTGEGLKPYRSEGKTDLEITSLLQIDPVVYEPQNCPLCAQGVELVKPGSRVGK